MEDLEMDTEIDRFGDVCTDYPTEIVVKTTPDKTLDLILNYKNETVLAILDLSKLDRLIVALQKAREEM